VYFTCCGQDQRSLHRRQGIGDMRQVRLQKEANEGLGVSITVSVAIVFDVATGFFTYIVSVGDKYMRCLFKSICIVGFHFF